MSDTNITAICPQCGAEGIANQKCEYCGAFIPMPNKDVSNKSSNQPEGIFVWENILPEGYSVIKGNSESLFSLVEKRDSLGNAIINREGVFVTELMYLDYFEENYDYLTEVDRNRSNLIVIPSRVCGVIPDNELILQNALDKQIRVKGLYYLKNNSKEWFCFKDSHNQNSVVALYNRINRQRVELSETIPSNFELSEVDENCSPIKLTFIDKDQWGIIRDKCDKLIVTIDGDAGTVSIEKTGAIEEYYRQKEEEERQKEEEKKRKEKEEKNSGCLFSFLALVVSLVAAISPVWVLISLLTQMFP